MSRYAFGHETATFLVCGRCGVIAAAVCEMEGRLYSVLNSNLLEPPLDVDRASVPVADYEAEDVPGRLARRKQRWIGNGHHRRALASLPKSNGGKELRQALVELARDTPRNIMWPPKASTRRVGAVLCQKRLGGLGPVVGDVEERWNVQRPPAWPLPGSSRSTRRR